MDFKKPKINPEKELDYLKQIGFQVTEIEQKIREERDITDGQINHIRAIVDTNHLLNKKELEKILDQQRMIINCSLFKRYTSYQKCLASIELL